MTDDAKDDTIEQLNQQLRFAIGRVYRRFRTLRAEGELGEAAMATLTRIRKVGAQTLTELADEARVAPSSMSQTVNRLVAGGYLARSADPADGRRVLLTLTDLGRHTESVTHARGLAWLDGQLQTLTPRERAVLAQASDILSRMSEN